MTKEIFWDIFQTCRMYGSRVINEKHVEKSVQEISPAMNTKKIHFRQRLGIRLNLVEMLSALSWVCCPSFVCIRPILLKKNNNENQRKCDYRVDSSNSDCHLARLIWIWSALPPGYLYYFSRECQSLFGKLSKMLQLRTMQQPINCQLPPGWTIRLKQGE